MRKSLTAGVLSLSLLTGYAAADVFDLVPGVLTRDKPTPPPAATTPSGPAPTLIPLPGPASGDPLPIAVGAHAAEAPTAGRERNLANQRTFLVTVTRLRDHLTLVVDSAAKLGKATAQNTGDKTSALEVTEGLRLAAAKGHTSGMPVNHHPAKQPPELTKERVKPFEIGI